MADSQHNVRPDGFQGSFKLLSISEIKRARGVYYVIRFQNTKTKRFHEKVIDVDGEPRCGGYYNYHTRFGPVSVRKLDYSDVIHKKDNKFIPQTYIPGDDDKTWVFDISAMLHIKYVEYKPTTGNHGGLMTFTITPSDLNEMETYLWKLHIESEHNGYYSHCVKMIDAKGNGDDPFTSLFVL